MANEMIKFYKGLEASLPAAGTSGALYITTDEGGIYLGTGTGMKRLGDFVQVANVAALPAKAHENCLYYCVSENILAKWNGTEWKQVNKQPTVDELKTLLGLGALAYKSEVAEGDLSAELKAKIESSDSESHTHANKDVLDGITADKVAAWDAAEKNAKDYADGLNTAMNGRVEALEAIDHTHANKELLDSYTQTEENLADAVAKKHEHTNKTELDKIAAGDKAKWDAVANDHLTSADKAALEDAIGDVATAVENEATTARAAEKANADAIAAIKDGTTVDSFADVEAELAKKVDKVTGKSLVDDAEITKLAGVSEGANKVEASTTNGNIKIDGVETVVYTHPAKHQITDIEGLQDALDGKQSGGSYAEKNHVHTKAQITDFAHTHIASEITDLDDTIKGYDYATKTEAKGYADAKDEAIAAAQKTADDITTYVGTFTASEGVDTVVKYIDAKTANIASDETVNALDERLTQAENDIDAIEADYLKAADKTELQGKIDAEVQRATGAEGALSNRLDLIEKDYLVAEDKVELNQAILDEKARAEAAEAGLQTQINTIMNNPDTEGVINSINEFTQYIEEHGDIADGFRTDIDANKAAIEAEAARADAAEKANAKAIADQAVSDAETYETKVDAKAKFDEAKGYADGINDALDARVKKLEAIDHDAYVAADSALKAELQAEIDSDVKALADGQVAQNKADIAANAAAIATKANAADVYTKTEVDTMFTWGEF